MGTIITGIGEAAGRDDDSLESMVHRAAQGALDDAGVVRDEIDGVVLAASDQVDGRAISSMLTSGPAGAYLNEEINTASSPGHALALAYMQILSGTHQRLLVSSWGKTSEAAGGSTQAAERLCAEPFFERDGGLSGLAASALQALARRANAADRVAADTDAARVAARNHGRGVDEVLSSPLVAFPLRALELPPETDGAFSMVLERAGLRSVPSAVGVCGAGWCSDTARIADRDLVGVPHLHRAAADAYARAGVGRPVDEVKLWLLHDYTPDAELLAYPALGLCSAGDERAVLDGDSAVINPDGGSIRGEPPFGGPLGKVLSAVRRLRSRGGRERAVVQIASGFAGQFQSVFVLGGASA